MASIQEFEIFCKNVKKILPAWMLDTSDDSMIRAWYGDEYEKFTMDDFRVSFAYIRKHCQSIENIPNSAGALISVCEKATNKIKPKRELLDEVLKLISAKSRDQKYWGEIDPLHSVFIQRMGGIDRLADASPEQMVWIRKEADVVMESLNDQIETGLLRLEERSSNVPDISAMIKAQLEEDKKNEVPKSPHKPGGLLAQWKDIKKELNIKLPDKDRPPSQVMKLDLSEYQSKAIPAEAPPF